MDENEDIQSLSKDLGTTLIDLLNDKQCSKCGDKATGIGANNFYCTKCFWLAFDEMEKSDI